MDSKSRHLK